MSRQSPRLIKEGLMQAVAAIGTAAATAALIAWSAPSPFGFAGRLAVAATLIFGIALVFGSARVVGLTTLPMLAAAIAAFATATQALWVRSIVIGILWYVACELGWDAIERRGGAKRGPALDYRRAYEVSTVVTIALAIAVTAFVASNLAPTRTLLSVGFVVIGLFVALAMATRHVDESGPESG